ncbi:hypothetical protein [Spirochaeta thermophila]|uniref:DUF2933 domain-containing protein n=1 Tax=Winmispira thermophila (strain ATCC 49972 / DSM 6192 / RI 19.B1) TaxID=665571 RepID=E0RTR0_WINT6|nr:hypothetical protein [Spirochaeta thermophila]ADN02435.1 hypothetical protein STHERM_c14950 [Spirochaeta thermophila DSM 6192]
MAPHTHSSPSHPHRHPWWMMALCVLPMALLGGVFLLAPSSLDRGWLLTLFLLLCPLLHLGMIPLMVRHNEEEGARTDTPQKEEKPLLLEYHGGSHDE